MKSRNKLLSIAGFDPSGGAGILADVRTFEANHGKGFAINTANTIQNETTFTATNWISDKEILAQLNLLLENHTFQYVKIGLISSFTLLSKIIHVLKKANNNVSIIWDPVLSASAGFNFNHNLDNLKNILPHIFLITPNWEEVQVLSGNTDAILGAKELNRYTNVYLKGGHNKKQLGKDFLFYKDKAYTFNPKNKLKITPKHGSGCVLSSAITANLAKEYTIIKVCLRSKRFIERYLTHS